jgi:hypothetical protein
MASPVSGLSLEDNLFSKMMVRKEVSSLVPAVDFGYNRIQTLMNYANKNTTIKVNQVKVNVGRLGNTTIMNIVNGAPVLSGTSLVVPLQNADNRFRLKDIVKDANYAQGRVIAVTPTSLTLEPTSVAWNAATHFQNGSTVVVIGDSSGSNSVGKSSLSYSPDFDFAILNKARETYKQDLEDRINTEILYKGKFWYAAQQMITMQRFSKSNELKLYMQERVEPFVSSLEGKVSYTGGLRWSAKNNGGTYYPLSANPTEDDIQDFLKTMIGKQASAKRKIVFFCGKESLFAIQNFLKDNIIHSGQNNSFGGKDVSGYNITKYAIGGTEIDVTEYPLFNDELLFGDLSNITGKPKAQSNILAIDFSPTDSANGGSQVPTIQKYCFEGPEVYMKFIPGMLPGLGDLGKEVLESNGFGLATNDSDSSSIELMEFSGYYIVPQKVGLMELVS